MSTPRPCVPHEPPSARRPPPVTPHLPDDALVSLVVGSRDASAARSLVRQAGSIDELERACEEARTELALLKPASVRRLAAAFELGRRAHALRLARLPDRLSGFDEVVSWARPRLAPLDHEEVWMLALDGRNGLRSAQRVAQGGLHGCALTPRDVLGPALKAAASAIVLVHNHPSGVADPSPADVSMTEVLLTACDMVGITLLDHVIVARLGAASVLQWIQDSTLSGPSTP